MELICRSQQLVVVVGGRQSRTEQLAFVQPVGGVAQPAASIGARDAFPGRLSAWRNGRLLADGAAADSSAQSVTFPAASVRRCQRSQPQFQFEFEHQSAATGLGPHVPPTDVPHQLAPRIEQQSCSPSSSSAADGSPRNNNNNNNNFAAAKRNNNQQKPKE